MKRVLGPIIGHVDASTATLWIRTNRSGAVKVRVFTDVDRRREVDIEQQVTVLDEPGGSRVVQLGGLDAETRYAYEVVDDTGTSLLSPAASRACSFRTAPDPRTRRDLRFGVVSCNKPFVRVEDPMAMWRRLDRAVTGEDLRFLLMVGDQIYADRAYNRLAKLRDPSPEKSLAAYRREYELQWRKEEIQRVMGSVSSYKIWDDHEIRNGWGSDKRDTKAAKRRAIFHGARRAYAEFQHATNPQTFGGDRFDYGFRHGSVGVFVLDLRGRRDHNRKTRPLLGSGPWRDFRSWVGRQGPELSALFVVTSVPVAHTPSFIANLFSGVSDLRDQWSFKPNKPERRSLVRFLFDTANQREIPVTLLSGDVHVGSVARFRSRDPAHRARPEIVQLTSSPIANQSSTLLSKLQFAKDRVRRIDEHIDATILDVQGRRNFGVVDVAHGAEGGAAIRFALHREGVADPVRYGPF